YLNRYLSSEPVLKEIEIHSELHSERTDCLYKVKGFSLKGVKAYGKIIIFDFGDIFLLSSLGMTGGWFYEIPTKHLRFALIFEMEGKTLPLYYKDMRYFGRVKV